MTVCRKEITYNSLLLLHRSYNVYIRGRVQRTWSVFPNPIQWARIPPPPASSNRSTLSKAESYMNWIPCAWWGFRIRTWQIHHCNLILRLYRCELIMHTPIYNAGSDINNTYQWGMDVHRNGWIRVLIGIYTDCLQTNTCLQLNYEFQPVKVSNSLKFKHHTCVPVSADARSGPSANWIPLNSFCFCSSLLRRSLRDQRSIFILNLHLSYLLSFLSIYSFLCQIILSQ